MGISLLKMWHYRKQGHMLRQISMRRPINWLQNEPRIPGWKTSATHTRSDACSEGSKRIFYNTSIWKHRIASKQTLRMCEVPDNCSSMQQLGKKVIRTLFSSKETVRCGVAALKLLDPQRSMSFSHDLNFYTRNHFLPFPCPGGTKMCIPYY